MRFSPIFASVLLVLAPATSFGKIPSLRNAASSPIVASGKAALRLNTVAITASSDLDSSKDTGATISTSTFNLAKNIIGAGVLSLPAGVAFIADSPAALVPSALLTTLMGLVSAYSFSLIGKACAEHNSKSFQETWAKSVDPKTAWMISAGITAMCFLTALAYSIIIGDSFASLATTFGLPAALSSRSSVILGITSLVLFPLCSLRSLSALTPFSLLGLGGTLYAALFMGIRYLDKSYLPGGKFFGSIAAAAKPVFNQNPTVAINYKLFVLLSMLSTSYIAHFNAPKFYQELKNKSMGRFNQVVGGAFGISISLFLFVMAVGFSTFGGNSMGFILNNYASSDKLATLARLAIGGALLTGYPFTFSAIRDGIFDLQEASEEKRAKATTPLTIGILGAITSLALVLKDVGFVVSISGALFGCILLFVLPAVMNISNLNRSSKTKALTSADRFEVKSNYAMIAVGILMTILGVGVSVLKQLGKL